MNGVVECEWCGEQFEQAHAKGPKPKFCSVGHRQSAYRARQMASFALEVQSSSVDDVHAAARSILRQSMRPFLESSAFKAQANLAESMRSFLESTAYKSQANLAELVAASLPRIPPSFDSQLLTSIRSATSGAFGSILTSSTRDALAGLVDYPGSRNLASSLEGAVATMASSMTAVSIEQRAALSRLLGGETQNLIADWSIEDALSTAAELAEIAAGEVDDASDDVVLDSAVVLLSTLLGLVAAIAPMEALQSCWIVGQLVLSAIGHLDSNNHTFHGLVVVLGILSILSVRKK